MNSLRTFLEQLKKDGEITTIKKKSIHSLKLQKPLKKTTERQFSSKR